MDLKITTLGGDDAGKLELSDGIFGLDPREDILQRVVRWQLAKKQQGTHQAKGRADIAPLRETKDEVPPRGTVDSSPVVLCCRNRNDPCSIWKTCRPSWKWRMRVG